MYFILSAFVILCLIIIGLAVALKAERNAVQQEEARSVAAEAKIHEAKMLLFDAKINTAINGMDPFQKAVITEHVSQISDLLNAAADSLNK